VSEPVEKEDDYIGDSPGMLAVICGLALLMLVLGAGAILYVYLRIVIAFGG
jgi:hypothetical protein